MNTIRRAVESDVWNHTVPQFPPMSNDGIVKELQEERNRIDAAIKALQSKEIKKVGLDTMVNRRVRVSLLRVILFFTPLTDLR